MCLTDQVWSDILKCSHTGDCTKDDIAEIQKLVLVNKQCDVPDFLSQSWNDTMLVTPKKSSHML